MSGATGDSGQSIIGNGGQGIPGDIGRVLQKTVVRRLLEIVAGATGDSGKGIQKTMVKDCERQWSDGWGNRGQEGFK